MSTSRHQALRDHLIAPTLEFCAHNVPYYREVFGERWREVSCMADLHKLPLLDKTTAIAVQDGLRSGIEPIPSPVLSSGTKRDGTQVLEVLVSERELEEQRNIIEKLNGPAEGPARRELIIINAHHGLPFERSSSHRVLVPFMPHDNSFVQVLRLLERVFDDDTQIEAILASVGNLKALTVWLLERDIDPSTLAVRNIGTNSSVLTRGWRETLSRLWDARLWDNYSLSEFRTHATECELCAHYHFDHLPIGIELIDPRTSALSTDASCAELVLTSLYPYAQSMPLVRYRTGDLVEVHEGCESGELGFGFLGRASDCVVNETGLVASTRDVLECLEALPEVQRETTLFEQLGMIGSGQLGWPIFQLGQDALRVHLTFTPALYPARANAVREALGGLTRGQIEIQLAGPEVTKSLRTRAGPEAKAKVAGPTRPS